MQRERKRFSEICFHDLCELINSLLHPLPTILKMYCFIHTSAVHFAGFFAKKDISFANLSTLWTPQSVTLVTEDADDEENNQTIVYVFYCEHPRHRIKA